MCICSYVYVYVYVYMYICIYVYMYICICIYVCICMYVYIYIYIHTHTHTCPFSFRERGTRAEKCRRRRPTSKLVDRWRTRSARFARFARFADSAHGGMFKWVNYFGGGKKPSFPQQEPPSNEGAPPVRGPLKNPEYGPSLPWGLVEVEPHVINTSIINMTNMINMIDIIIIIFIMVIITVIVAILIILLIILLLLLIIIIILLGLPRHGVVEVERDRPAHTTRVEAHLDHLLLLLLYS